MPTLYVAKTLGPFLPEIAEALEVLTVVLALAYIAVAHFFPEEQARPEPSRCLAVDGNIGAGKSTLCSELASAYAHTVQLHREKIAPAMLDLLYAKPKGFAFAFQLWMLAQRRFGDSFVQRQLAPRGTLHLNDRSLFGDYCFALWNYAEGNFGLDEMRVYQQEAGGASFTELLQSGCLGQGLDLWVYLHDEARRCKKRADARGGPEQDSLCESYYTGVALVHFNCLFQLLQDERMAERVRVRTWSQYSDTKREAQALYEEARGADALPHCGHVENLGVLGGQDYRRARTLDWHGLTVFTHGPDGSVVKEAPPANGSWGDGEVHLFLENPVQEPAIKDSAHARLKRVGLTVFPQSYMDAFLKCAASRASVYLYRVE